MDLSEECISSPIEAYKSSAVGALVITIRDLDVKILNKYKVFKMAAQMDTSAEQNPEAFNATSTKAAAAQEVCIT